MLLLNSTKEKSVNSDLNLSLLLENEEAITEIHSKLVHLRVRQREAIACLVAKYKTLFGKVKYQRIVRCWIMII